MLQGSYSILNSWKSHEICPVIFQMRKSLESREKVYKEIVKKSEFFSKLQVPYKKIFFILSNRFQSHPIFAVYEDIG